MEQGDQVFYFVRVFWSLSRLCSVFCVFEGCEFYSLGFEDGVFVFRVCFFLVFIYYVFVVFSFLFRVYCVESDVRLFCFLVLEGRREEVVVGFQQWGVRGVVISVQALQSVYWIFVFLLFVGGIFYFYFKLKSWEKVVCLGLYVLFRVICW